MGFERLRIRLAGAGGHGIVFAGRWLGTTLVLSGLEVSLRPYYSPAQRGGWSKCDMVVTRAEEEPPILDEVDVLVVTLQSLYHEEIANVRPGGVVVVEADAVRDRSKRSDVIEVPYEAFRVSLRLSNEPRYGNAALVGFLCGFLGLAPLEKVEEALRKLGARNVETNIRVASKGYEDGIEYRKRYSVPPSFTS